MFRWGNRTSHLGRMKNSSYYIAPVGDRTHDLPHTAASNMVKVSHALNHLATEAVIIYYSKKSTVVVCRNKAMMNAVRPSFIANGDVIPESEKVKYLGHNICE